MSPVTPDTGFWSAPQPIETSAGAGMILFDRFLGIARPVAADAIVRERHGVAGIANPRGPQLAVEILHGQQRQIVIDRPARRAAVLGDRRAADSPREPCCLAVLERGQRDLLQMVGQLGRVAVDMRLVLRRNRHAKERDEHVGDHRRRVRVRERDGEPLARQAAGAVQSLGHFLDHCIRHAAIIDRQHHRRALCIAADRQRLGPDPLRHAFRFFAAKTEPAEPHRIVRRDIDRRHAHLDRRRLPGRLALAGFDSAWHHDCPQYDCQ
ncbi:MAG TPA: hypothetical protein VGN42_17010 [Pirellulales bacterium]|nr:hypothetical protein [Pirellulales bacterium]